MVRRMTKRAATAAPFLVGVLWLLGGPRYGVSGAIGLAMALANLWFSAFVIGGIADKNPQMLLPVGMATFVGGLFGLTGVAFLLQHVSFVFFPVAGFVLIASHLSLVLWDAAAATGSEVDHSTANAAGRIRS